MSGGGGGAGLMSCVREGSLEPPYRPPHQEPHNHGEGRTGRFLRGLRRMFKRRGSGARAVSPDPKSSSTSELLDADRHARRKEGAYSSGLSVSHDSVFTGERSGDESSDERTSHSHGLQHLATTHRVTNLYGATTPAHCSVRSASAASRGLYAAELVAAVRRRGRGDGSDDDEDLGLPRSPPASPPTDKADKRHHAGISQSSCSDGSLLSVGSSEIDEDSSSHQLSHDHSAKSDQSDLYTSSEPPTGVAPLSHSAAKHKMAVRPRRTHGAPRRKKTSPIAASALPITPELNEEMIRSTTPDVARKTSEVVTESLSSSTTTKHTTKEHHLHVNRELQRVLDTPSDTKLKSSSLPPGLALSQLVGHSPKLSVADASTPRSSIKRSKSSSQDQTLRNSPKTHAKSTETHINSSHSEERMTKYRTDRKHAEESCPEKKSKSEKKMENEVIKSSKREESFFSRLLLRKSGKKPKKDQIDGDSHQDIKRSKVDKPPAQYKPVDIERGSVSHGEQAYKPVPAERTHKSAGQKAFANQMHKRMDNRGGYVQDGAYKDVYSAAKVPGVEYNITDLKIADETDKLLNQEMKNRFSRREDTEKIERSKRSSSKEVIDENKRESFSLHHDKTKRPASVQRLIDPTKAFISNEIASRAQEELVSPKLVISDEEPPPRAIRINKVHGDYTFHSGSMPKNIPYFNPSLTISTSTSPPKVLRHLSSENVRNRSSERVADFSERVSESKRISKTEESYIGSGMRSLGDEFIESRSSIGKSHSFRYASETTSISSQENQMPSLPAIVGISEPLLESWEVNYRKNISERNDFSKRISARNYNILHGTAEATYDSLPSTDSSYLDSLKTDINEDRKLFTNSIHINLDSHKRDSDISQIEAKIDDIISSPKPIISPILKSSSLDSVKSSPEKPVDDRRKTISVESALSQGGKVSGSQKELKHEAESFISVTHINKEQTQTKMTEVTKINKSDEKLQKSGKPGVPEFLNIQLNKVDAKPAINIVLTANVTPKKIDSPQAEKELDVETFQVVETKTVPIIDVKKEAGTIKTEINTEMARTEESIPKTPSPAFARKSVAAAPPSPSTPKNFFKRKAASVELQDRPDHRTNSVSTDGSSERIFDNISMDQKSHSSFGSKSSIQSTDSNDAKTPDRHDDAVVYRKKPVLLAKEFRASERKNDDEPELMKVFARRSLKIKDTEADSIAQEIAATKDSKDEINESSTNRTKVLKNEFNASIKSRDSDKENEDSAKESEKRTIDIAARVSQFGVPHYQRSVSINGVNPKRESAPAYRGELHKYKKEVSDSTPEKRLRNRTFPDPANDREDIKTIANSEAYKADTLRRPWQKKEEEKRGSTGDKEKRESAVIEKDREAEGERGKDAGAGAGAGAGGGAGAGFRGIVHVRAEWERRAQQGMAK